MTYFCVGWHLVDSQVKHYHDTLFDSWHEADQIANGLKHGSIVVFVDTVTKTRPCPRCNGSGNDPDDLFACSRCFGKGIVRDYDTKEKP